MVVAAVGELIGESGRLKAELFQPDKEEM